MTSPYYLMLPHIRSREADYLSMLVHSSPMIRKSYPHARWPPDLEALLASGASPSNIPYDTILAAVNADDENLDPPAERLKEFEGDLNLHEDRIQEFFADDRFGLEVPEIIAVHITRYGPGGGYHPVRESLLSPTLPAISAHHRYLSGRTFVQNLVHETVHLVIEEAVIRRPAFKEAVLGAASDLAPQAREEKLHKAKEALVDKICSCDELNALFGARYPVQKWAAPELPQTWRMLVPWKREPSWT